MIRTEAHGQLFAVQPLIDADTYYRRAIVGQLSKRKMVGLLLCLGAMMVRFVPAEWEY